MTDTTDAGHPVVTADEWRAARLDHLAAEKDFTRARAELAAQRRDLPWVEITTDYRFETPAGAASLSDLFGENPQLVVMHFMLGPGWVDGCPMCSFWADNYDGTMQHLAARNTTFVAVARAPLAEIDAYRERMGWSFPFVSSHESTFNYDFGVSFTPEQVASGEQLYNYGTAGQGEEMPGMSAFRRTDDGRIYLTYQTFARGLDVLNSAYHFLDATSAGRDEESLEWSMAWVRRHDEY